MWDRHEVLVANERWERNWVNRATYYHHYDAAFRLGTRLATMTSTMNSYGATRLNATQLAWATQLLTRNTITKPTTEAAIITTNCGWR